MRTLAFLCAALVAFSTTNDLLAQTGLKPAEVTRTSAGYDRYYAQGEDAVPSASDAPAAVEGNGTGLTAGGCDSAAGCGDCCDNCGCDDCCGWCNLGDPWTLWKCADSGINYGGWVSIGYYNESTGLFNSHPDAVRLPQAWLYAEKTAQGVCEWDWGARVDIMYGTDAQDTQAFGQPTGWDTDWDNGIYGWALPQVYFTLNKDDLTLKLGHFYTLVGYEVVPAPDNFFFSHAFTMYNSEPFTHTGILASYAVNEKVEVYGGWTLGWDTGFDNFMGGSNFLGGVGYQVTDKLKATYITTIGNMGARGSGYTHSLVFDWVINDKWEYVLQSDLVDLHNGFQNHEYGVNNYLFYTINDCLKAGVRFEWWNTDTVTGISNSSYEITGGINIRPHANLVLRPEIRYDWGVAAANNDNAIFGIDAILTF